MATPLNPFRDPGPWGIVTIGGLRLAGVIRSIDGAERPEEWVVQRPTILSGAITIWRGTKIAETIKIVTDLANAEEYDKYVAMQKVLRPKIGGRPPTHAIVNPKINFSAITRSSCRNVGSPKWEESLGSWSGEITLLQYSPPRIAATGPADAPKTEVDPNADVKARAKITTAAFNKEFGSK